MRKQRFMSLVLLFAVWFPLLVVREATAHDCAFQDVNDNGVFDGGDVAVPDASWLGGNLFLSNHPFVVPVGCDHEFVASLPSPLRGVRVIATKVSFLGVLRLLFSGGEGATFIADPSMVPAPGLGDGDIIVGDGATLAKIEAPGTNKLALSIEALPKSSVALWAAGKAAVADSGKCTVSTSELRGLPVTGSGKVGFNCKDDITIRQTTIEAAGINIQSLAGKIDARSAAAVAGPTLADLCDDPVNNLVGGAGPPGNGDLVKNPPDFPCDLNLGVQFPGVTSFANVAALDAFCDVSGVGGVNVFKALNNPLIMISQELLDLSGSAGGGGDTIVQGRFRVTLAAVDGNIDTSNTQINNDPDPPNGAKIWLFADPTAVNRLSVEHEDFFGPSAGTTDIDGACYRSPNPVHYGDAGASIIGIPDPPPCKQIGNFVPVANGIF